MVVVVRFVWLLFVGTLFTKECLSFQDAITNLKQQCSDYVMTRSIQCREMMDDLQRKIAGLSFTDNRPARSYPPIGTTPSTPAPSQGSHDSSHPPYYQSSSTIPTPSSQPAYPGYQGSTNQTPGPPPYFAGQNQPGMPRPPYYSQPPSHQPSQNQSQNFSQPPYPGWQGSYYNGPPAPPQSGVSPQSPYPTPPPGGYYNAPSSGYYK